MKSKAHARCSIIECGPARRLTRATAGSRAPSGVHYEFTSQMGVAQRLLLHESYIQHRSIAPIIAVGVNESVTMGWGNIHNRHMPRVIRDVKSTTAVVDMSCSSRSIHGRPQLVVSFRHLEGYDADVGILEGRLYRQVLTASRQTSLSAKLP